MAFVMYDDVHKHAHVMYNNDGLYNSVTLDYCIVHGSSSTKMLNLLKIMASSRSVSSF